MFQCKKNIDFWFKNRSTVLFNSTIVFLGILLVTQALLLLDFLPKLIGKPDTFPIRATCELKNKTLIENLCQTVDELSQGGLEKYWQKCRVAKYYSTYKTDEQLFDIKQSVGECLYWYPQIITSIGQQLPKTNKTYDCWFNPTDKLCFIFFPKKIYDQFIYLQTVLGCFWILTLVFFLYIYGLYRVRKTELLPILINQ